MENKIIELKNNTNIVSLVEANVDTLKNILSINNKLAQDVEANFIESEMYYINDIMDEIRGACSNWSIGFYNHNYINIKDGGAFLDGLEQIQNKYCLLSDTDAEILAHAQELNNRLYWFDCDNKQYENLENKVNSLIEELEEIFIKNINNITDIDADALEDYFINCYIDNIDAEKYFYNVDTLEVFHEVHYIKSYV